MGLDTVELVMAWEEEFGIAISDSDAEKMLTVRNAIDHIALRLGVADGPGVCPSMRAFHRLRRDFRLAGFRRRDIRPSTRYQELLSNRAQWLGMRMLPTFRALPPYRKLKKMTLGDSVQWVLDDDRLTWRRPDEPLTKPWLRVQVRQIIVEQLGVDRGFRDDDEFIRDLGAG